MVYYGAGIMFGKVKGASTIFLHKNTKVTYVCTYICTL